MFLRDMRLSLAGAGVVALTEDHVVDIDTGEGTDHVVLSLPFFCCIHSSRAFLRQKLFPGTVPSIAQFYREVCVHFVDPM